MAFSTMPSRPYPSLNTNTSSNLNGSTTSGSLKSPLGNGAGPWGARTASIWGSSSLATRPSTADKGQVSKGTATDANNDNTAKKGSGSLLDSSESDVWSSRQFRPALSTQLHRNTDSDVISPTATRPPTVNLTNPAFSHQRSVFAPPFLNTTFSEPPAVYPKNKDRPHPGTYTPADSVIDHMSTSTSPSNERRPFWSTQHSSTNSVSTSRDQSRAPQTYNDRRFPVSGTEATAGRYNQYPQTEARSGSLSSAADLATAFDTLSLRPIDRPSSSRSLPPGTRLMHEIQNEVDQALLSNVDHLLQPQSQAMQQYGNLSYGANTQQMLPFGLNHNDRSPNDAFNSYFTFATQPTTQRQHNGWQDGDVSPTAVARRSAMPQEQQFFLDPRFTAHMLAMKTPYTNGFTGLAPTSYNALQSFTPYYAAGLGTIPPSLPAPEVEQGLQSAKLFDFKMAGKNTRKYELRDIYEHIAEFAGDQHGSRFIQTKLETANSDEKERVFREIEPNAIPLMTDVFGNYVIQKFFDHGHQEHKRILAGKMRGQVLALSTQMYGCRVVQKALEHVLLEQQAALVNELKHHVLKCVKDQNGNHVIQKVIERCSADSISFVYEAFIGQAHSLSLHPYGCRVIQRCLERTEWFAAKPIILAELHEGVPKGMIGDSYGNYVVQHIVQNGPEDDRRYVLGIVLADVESFSKHKFASNVVEKCIEYSDDNWRRQVVEIFTNGDHRRPEHESILVGLIKDQYGNYVIQRLLDRLLMQDYIYFHHQLQPAMTHAKRTGSGKQVVSIEKKMQRFDFVPSVNESGQPMAPAFPNHFAPMNCAPVSRSGNGFNPSMLPTMNNGGDTVEGAISMSRKNSEAFGEHTAGRQ